MVRAILGSSFGPKNNRASTRITNISWPPSVPMFLLYSTALHWVRHTSTCMRDFLLRAALEAGFIIFLFYSNLLMGEYEKSGMGRTKGLAWALRDIFTSENFAIAILAAIVGW